MSDVQRYIKQNETSSLTRGCLINHIINNTKTNNHWAVRVSEQLSDQPGCKGKAIFQTCIINTVKFLLHLYFNSCNNGKEDTCSR